MLYKMSLRMTRIGSVLLDLILMTLSQKWGTHVEFVAKTWKDSNSLLNSLRMWFLDFFFNFFLKESKTQRNNPSNAHCQFYGKPTVDKDTSYFLIEVGI